MLYPVHGCDTRFQIFRFRFRFYYFALITKMITYANSIYRNGQSEMCSVTKVAYFKAFVLAYVLFKGAWAFVLLNKYKIHSGVLN